MAGADNKIARIAAHGRRTKAVQETPVGRKMSNEEIDDIRARAAHVLREAGANLLSQALGIMESPAYMANFYRKSEDESVIGQFQKWTLPPEVVSKFKIGGYYMRQADSIDGGRLARLKPPPKA